jgi:hypothetical protein
MRILQSAKIFCFLKSCELILLNSSIALGALRQKKEQSKNNTRIVTSQFERVYRLWASPWSPSRELTSLDFYGLSGFHGAFGAAVHFSEANEVSVVFESGRYSFGPRPPYFSNTFLDFERVGVGYALYPLAFIEATDTKNIDLMSCDLRVLVGKENLSYRNSSGDSEIYNVKYDSIDLNIASTGHYSWKFVELGASFPDVLFTLKRKVANQKDIIKQAPDKNLPTSILRLTFHLGIKI